jgi:hypothetical protein
MGTDMDTFMSKAMAAVNDKTDAEIAIIKKDFVAAMNLAFQVFDKEAFRKVYRTYKRIPPINKALFDALSAQFALCSDAERSAILNRKKELKKMLKDKLAHDAYFFASVTSSTGDRNKARYRHEMVKTIILTTIQ